MCSFAGNRKKSVFHPFSLPPYRESAHFGIERIYRAFVCSLLFSIKDFSFHFKFSDYDWSNSEIRQVNFVLIFSSIHTPVANKLLCFRVKKERNGQFEIMFLHFKSSSFYVYVCSIKYIIPTYIKIHLI